MKTEHICRTTYLSDGTVWDIFDAVSTIERGARTLDVSGSG